MAVELTVLGTSGSYGSPAGGACSGYLVRAGDTTLWVDCGNGTFANLQRHALVDDLTAVVITHGHPDHCVDVYGLHVMLTYGTPRAPLPIYAPAGLRTYLGALVHEWGPAFVWEEAGDGDRAEIGDAVVRFSRTDHPPPTLAVEVAHGDKRLVYTADTGPGWSVGAFGAGADLVLSEATYQDGYRGPPFHLTAAEAGAGARAAEARRLMLTHLWPTLDPVASVAEAEEAFGAPVTLAAPHLAVPV